MTEHCIAPQERGDPAPCTEPRAPGSLFCRRHEAAPAAQRGGWISAEQRRRRLAGHAAISNVAQRLWLGQAPPPDQDLPRIDLLVLCLPERPTGHAFHGRLVWCGVTAELSIHDIRRALLAGHTAALALRVGKTVLVADRTGHGDAALVTGLALGFSTRMTPAQITALIRARRSKECLRSPPHQKVLETYLGRRR